MLTAEYSRSPIPFPTWTWKTAAAIAAVTRTSATTEPTAIPSHLKNPRMRWESRRARVTASAASSSVRGSGSPCRVTRRIAPPASARTTQTSPCGQKDMFETTTAPATASSPSPISGHGRSRRCRSVRVANESSWPSAGITSAAAA